MRNRVRRRETEFANLSFLDCICCGFGAVILLLVLTKFAEPVLLEQTTVELEAIIRSLEEELEEIRGETRIVNQELTAKKEQLSEADDRWYKPYENVAAIEDEMRKYLTWEIALVEQIERDGDANFRKFD